VRIARRACCLLRDDSHVCIRHVRDSNRSVTRAQPLNNPACSVTSFLMHVHVPWFRSFGTQESLAISIAKLLGIEGS
jgi:hypothetical protein